MDSVDVRRISQHVSVNREDDLNSYKENGECKRWPRAPFPINPMINQKVILFDGDLELLRADVIVNPTNENLTQIGPIGKLAGPELESYLRRRCRSCATADVRITPGFKSNFKNIIHAVPPKYQPKYRTAAETALFHTYFRILSTMVEKRLRTVVMPLLNTNKCNLPTDENFQMQLRVIRRMLEKKAKDFDKIVVHIGTSGKMDSLSRLFFCYFPQTELDEEIACYKLCATIGGPNGEPVIPEREIRIKGKPGKVDSRLDNDASIDLRSGLDLSTVVGKTSFSRMHDDLDKHRSNWAHSPILAKGGCSPIQPAGSCNQIVTVRKPKMFRACVIL